jgi:hypothetical protein
MTKPRRFEQDDADGQINEARSSNGRIDKLSLSLLTSQVDLMPLAAIGENVFPSTSWLARTQSSHKMRGWLRVLQSVGWLASTGAIGWELTKGMFLPLLI